MSLIKKYDVPVPRYTSFPTAPQWKELSAKEGWKQEVGNYQGCDLYLHIPFCKTLCWYCGCHRKITKNPNAATTYIKAMKKEWDHYKKLNPSLTPRSIHFGGGTPNFLNAEELIDLIQYFGQEKLRLSIELDPRTLTLEHLDYVLENDFHHLSFGIQDFDIQVQTAINRIQPFNLVRSIVSQIRERSSVDINFDLIFGLPRQSKRSIQETIEKVRELAPEHIALYSYAHLPQSLKNQRLIKEQELPTGEEKRELYELAKALLQEQGYEEIGLDHFALRSSPLAKARENKALKRSFMGYTEQKEDLLIGLGASSISESLNFYTQNIKNIDEYIEVVNRGELATVKGFHLSPSDREIKKIINELMCHYYLPLKDFKLNEWQEEKLQEMSDDGLLIPLGDDYHVTDLGKVTLRNIASVFDPYLKSTQTRYSQSI